MNEELREQIEAAVTQERERCLAVIDEYGRTHFGTANANTLRRALAAQPAAVSLPEEAEPAGICGWRLTEWDRCTRPADHEGACA